MDSQGWTAIAAIGAAASALFTAVIAWITKSTAKAARDVSQAQLLDVIYRRFWDEKNYNQRDLIGHIAEKDSIQPSTILAGYLNTLEFIGLIAIKKRAIDPEIIDELFGEFILQCGVGNCE